MVTLGNTPNTDILCSNVSGTKFVHIQVKTFVPGGATCSVGIKAERNFGESFFWALGGIPDPAASMRFLYYIIPSAEMAKHVTNSHRKWMETPGLKGQKHNDSNLRMVHLPPRKSNTGWDISSYLEKWELIEAALR